MTVRIIRTEMYFDATIVRDSVSWDGRPLRSLVPSICIVWIPTPNEMIFNLKDINEFSIFPESELISVADFIRFTLIGDGSGSRLFAMVAAGFGTQGEVSDAVIKYILGSNIIVVNSPPVDVPFNVLLSNATSISVGTYIGAEAAGNESLLMLITVPAGIIIVGSAIGVSKGLENGLSLAIASLIKRKLK